MNRASGAPEPLAARAAALLLEARASARTLVPAERPELRDAADAYRVQDLVVGALAGGRRVHVWKVIAPRAGSGPYAAPIPPASVCASPATFAASGSNRVAIEAEIAFRFGHDLRSLPPDEAVREAVSETLVAIEICQSRLAEGGDAPLLWRLADLQSNAALVTGSGRPDWHTLDFARQRVEVWVDETLRASAVGSHPLRDPFACVPWFARHCAERGAGVSPGDLVTTGSWTGMMQVEPDSTVRVHFPGIGEARVRIERPRSLEAA